MNRLWSNAADPRPVRTFDAALDALLSGTVECAVLPTWNSTVGRIGEACGAIERRAASIVCEGEVELPVRHCLAALPRTAIADVRYVGSHPAALAQCSRLFRGPMRLVPCDAFDSAGAGQELALFGERAPWPEDPWYRNLEGVRSCQLAVIASATAARCYGLIVLRDDVQDDPSNRTRFVAVRARGGNRARG